MDNKTEVAIDKLTIISANLDKLVSMHGVRLDNLEKNNSYERMNSVLLYYSHDNNEKREKVVEALKKATGKEVVSLYGEVPRVETLYY